MQHYRSMITKLVWAVAVIAGATRMFAEKAFMLGLIEAVMILIAAFVALKTVDLILPQKKTGRTRTMQASGSDRYKGTALQP